MIQFEVKHLQTGDIVLERSKERKSTLFGGNSSYYDNVWIPIKNKIHHVNSKGIVEIDTLDWAKDKEVCVLRPLYRLTPYERQSYVEFANSITQDKRFQATHAVLPINNVRGWFPDALEITIDKIMTRQGYYIVRFEGTIK